MFQECAGNRLQNITSGDNAFKAAVFIVNQRHMIGRGAKDFNNSQRICLVGNDRHFAHQFSDIQRLALGYGRESIGHIQNADNFICFSVAHGNARAT